MSVRQASLQQQLNNTERRIIMDKEKLHQILSSLWENDDSVGKTYYNQALQDVQIAVDFQEEPVSDDLEEEIDNYIKRNGYDGLDSIEEVKYIAEYFTKWQKTKDDSCTSDLGDYINELSKQFPEVSFAKLSRIAVRVARWQKQQIMKDAVEGEIVKDIANNLYIGKAKVNKNNFKFGDKVKLLVLKEE